jgi:phytoene dehydrogenase-like protein
MLLRRERKMVKYDIVIIGGGIGGLAAGARLTAAGYRTLIIEKQSILGGRYNAADYKGYRITTAAYYIVHPNGPVRQLLKDVGVEFNLEIAEAPEPYLKYRIDGKDYPVPRKGGTMALLSSVAKPDEIAKIQNALQKAFKWQEPGDNITLKEWLSAYTDNEKIFQIFNTICIGGGGTTIDMIPAGEFFRVIKNYAKYGGVWLLPRGHLLPVVDGLVEVIKSNGGEIWTETRVNRILIDALIVKGVVTEKKGMEVNVEAKVVISNCSPRDMVKMSSEKNFDEGYLKRVREMKTSEMFNIIWGCDKPMFDFPGVINFPQCDPPWFAVDFSLTWRDLAPEGKYTMWAGFVLTYSSYNIKSEIEKGIKLCKENFPELEKHGEILLVQVFRKTWPTLWACAGTDLGQKSPVENLYVVGDGAKPSGYVMAEGVVEGARLVVEDIMQRIKLQ